MSINGIMILLAVFLFLGSPRVLIASSNDTDTSTSDMSPTGFYADHMIAKKDEGCVEYIGNVVFPLGRSVIKADNIKVFFNNAGGGFSLNEGSNQNIEDKVKKIVARGNINIVFEGLVATADKAVYESAVGSFVLTGDPAKLVNSSDTMSSTEITAEKIVFNRAEVSTEFIGNVIIAHEETVITADNVLAFFKKNAEGGFSLNEGSSENIEDLTEKIVARGNVKIVSEDTVATGDEAVYDSSLESFVLTGNPATLVLGDITTSSPVVEVIGKL